MNIIPKVALLTVLCISSISGSYAIVDTESKYTKKTLNENFFGNISAGYSKQQGNTNKEQLDLGTYIFFQHDKWQFTQANEGTYGLSSNVVDVNNFFTYIKTAYQIKKNKLAMEQVTQFEFDQFRKLLLRAVTGFGIRWTAINKDNIVLVLRFSHLPEYEKYSTGEKGWNQRFMNNTQLTYFFNDKIDISFLIYYEPVYTNWTGDYVITSATHVNFKILNKLNFRMSYNINYDSLPVENVKKLDTTFKNTIIYEF